MRVSDAGLRGQEEHSTAVNTSVIESAHGRLTASYINKLLPHYTCSHRAFKGPRERQSEQPGKRAAWEVSSLGREHPPGPTSGSHLKARETATGIKADNSAAALTRNHSWELTD